MIDQSIFYPKVSLASSDSLCKLHKIFDLVSNLYNAKYDKIQIALRWPSDMCEILPGRGSKTKTGNIMKSDKVCSPRSPDRNRSKVVGSRVSANLREITITKSRPRWCRTVLEGRQDRETREEV